MSDINYTEAYKDKKPKRIANHLKSKKKLLKNYRGPLVDYQQDAQTHEWLAVQIQPKIWKTSADNKYKNGVKYLVFERKEIFTKHQNKPGKMVSIRLGHKNGKFTSQFVNKNYDQACNQFEIRKILKNLDF